MKIFQTQSIRNKLICIILLVTMLAVGIGFIFVIVNQVSTFKDEMLNKMIVHAKLVGEYSVTPLAFGDPLGAEQILAKLDAVPYILNACIYKTDGDLFAVFNKPRKPVISFPVMKEMSYEFEKDYLHISQPIIYQKENYGTIYLRASTELIGKKVKQYLITMLLLIIGLLVLSYFLAHRFQRIVSQPILNLTDVTEKISEIEDYSIRVQYEGRDEIGILYDGFNNMLEKLQNREIERDMANKALRESEERYKQLYDDAPIGYHEIDAEGKIIRVNKTEADLLGYKIQEMIGNYIWKFIVPAEQAIAKKAIQGKIKERLYAEEYERKYVCKDGREIDIYIEERLIVNKKDKVTGFRSTLRDITARKKAQEQVKASLKEKEILLKEIHHRVKNNLQVICSLLRLQSKYINDKKAFEMFRESQDRIRSMALVHEKLYQSPDFAEINFAEYIKSLVLGLYRSYVSDPERIVPVLNIEEVSLGIDFAVPCGLIINELVSNALKHAFPSSWKGKGKIEIELITSEDNEIKLAIQDNGIGIPKDFDFRKTESLGLHLVTILVEDQLKGTIELERRKGARFQIKFTRPRMKEERLESKDISN